MVVAGALAAQGMLVDAAADKVITKYQTATCEELKAQRNQPRTDKEKEAVEFLRNAKEIKALASDAEVDGGGELHPFLVILPIKSYLHFVTVQLILRARGKGTTKDLDSVGTPHFAQFVPLEDNQIGFFTVYDGSFDKYIADFTKNIRQVFDCIFW